MTSVESEVPPDGSEPILCSVLNVVIDHSMEDPIPMEAREYQKQKQENKVSPIKVPVIRIFGPLLRDRGRGPLQSACLHVHGAFPYLLARPVVAGPDGSLKRVSSADGQINWDDPVSVEQIVNSLTTILEDAIQSLDMERRQRQDPGATGSGAPGHPRDVAPVIRQITVVQGRGFFTYCPGPIAPFLRVEYYDPKLRWKVKLMLERGLQVPLSYFPDPEQYDRNDEENNDVLSFHCYEAHIPYTMQFFKDFNLAGMTYLHVQQGKIRPSLRESCIAKYRGAPFDKFKDAPAVFLRSNTPPEFVWSPKPTIDSSGQKAPSQYDHYYHDPEFAPPAKSTIADVEIDCTVRDLRNIDTVLKTLPSELDERDKIQWRAVPSLQEIWRQERRRMAKLLSPEQDFLTPHPTATLGCDEFPKTPRSSLPFTLNVKKGAERSGARLAVGGMKSLVKLTCGLEGDFERALQQILKRHQKAIEQADHNILHPPVPSPLFATPGAAGRKRENLRLTPNIDEAIEAMDSLANLGAATPKTPSLGDAVKALELLHGGVPVEDPSVTPQCMNAPKAFTTGARETGIDVEATRMPALFLSNSQQSQATVGLTYPSSQEVHQDSQALTMIDPALLSQRIDRGDTVFQDMSAGRQNIEDYIDADTLLPYDNLDFGEDRCRVKFVVASDSLGSIRICGNIYSACRRDGHNHQDEGERAHPGYYKTVTTGTFVDGILDTSHGKYDDDEVDKEKFEKALSMMATQIPRTEAGDNEAGPMALSRFSHAQTSLTQGRAQHQNDYQGVETIVDGDHPTDSYDPQDLDDIYDDDNREERKTSTPKTDQGTVVLNASRLTLKIQPPGSYPACVIPSLQAPRICSVQASTVGNLYATNGERGSTPHWLTHVSRYTRTTAPSSNGLSCSVIEQPCFQPVRPPPTRRKIQAWCKKRSLDSEGGQVKRSKKLPDPNTARAPTLEIDSNSRKIVAMAQGDPAAPSKEIQSNFSDHKVEEVLWQSSEPSQLTMSQQWQKDQPSRAKAGTPKPASSTRASAGSHHGTSEGDTQSNTQTPHDALEGIGAQGGKIHVQGGGTLKAKIRSSPNKRPKHGKKGASTGDNASADFPSSPISFMSIEIHVQCRTGASRLDSKKISMAPDSSKDKIFAIVYVFGIDPGGGESLKVLERCCLFVRFHQEKTEKHIIAKALESSMPRANMGIRAPLQVECLDNEKRLLLRLSSLVTAKDPDMLLSWDTQGAGLGYIIERALVLGRYDHAGNQGPDATSADKPAIDMVRLLGRTPFVDSKASFRSNRTTSDYGEPASIAPVETCEATKWKGSGLGSEWDETVGAGAAAASIVGRLVFAGWKIVAEEVKHPNYSYLPAVAAAVLNKRIPYHDDLLLTQWYASGAERWRVLNHRLNQATTTLLLFDALDIVGRAGEAARLSGVEFSQSFPGIRGSQYKVEGVLLRALQSLRSDERGSSKGKKWSETPAKGTSTRFQGGSSGSLQEIKSMTQSPWKVRRGNNDSMASSDARHYFFFSPSLDDTNKQEALEVQALTLEPQSGHYTDPVVVCDFTALYPSLVIAYNLCYSTCAGKLDYHSTRREMQIEGRTRGRLGPFTYPERRTATVLSHHFKSLMHDSTSINNTPAELTNTDRGYIAPTGTIYVAEDVLKGVLPQVLDEILTTRAMLKRAAKEYKKHVKDLSPAILRQLEARQLALKYVANVTYGYTSATFSGRCAMPLLADTIVECGRKTLRKAIDMANRWGREGKWKGAKVIYGDTDSLFVRLPGHSYKEAFDFGEELCRAVTADNPPPVQLKLEKVYLGSIMQTMKRYCGMKFDSKNQKKPTFEAKGLETVRRDQCSLTQKVLRNALITLFKDGIEGVREYLQRQWSLIEAGNIPVADFILTGRVRSKYRGGREGPVQAVLAKRIGEADPGRIIRSKERLPYVIVATPGVTFRLKDCVLTPLELLERWDAYTVHSAYYIERHVNASLQRCLGLAPHFVDINAWYQACPKPRRRIHFWPVRSRSRAMITTYFGSDVCALCRQKCQASGRALVVVCADCRKDKTQSSQVALSRLRQVEIAAKQVAKECSRCNGCFEDSDTFASLLTPDDSESQKQKTMDLISGGPGGECLRLPLANCVCIDCPTTFKRHHLREQLIEATATSEVLEIL